MSKGSSDENTNNICIICGHTHNTCKCGPTFQIGVAENWTNDISTWIYAYKHKKHNYNIYKLHQYFIVYIYLYIQLILAFGDESIML